MEIERTGTGEGIGLSPTGRTQSAASSRSATGGRDESPHSKLPPSAHSKASLDEAFKHTLDVAHVLLVRTTGRDNDVVHIRDGDVGPRKVASTMRMKVPGDDVRPIGIRANWI